MQNRIVVLLILIGSLFPLCNKSFAEALDISDIGLNSPKNLEGKMYYASVPDLIQITFTSAMPCIRLSAIHSVLDSTKNRIGLFFH